MLQNRFGKKQIRLILISSILLLIICPLTSISQTENYWDITRDAYSFTRTYERTSYDIYGSGKIDYSNTSTENIVIWDVNNTDNVITFRTTKWRTFVGFCECVTGPCMDAFLELLEFDNETDSVKATYQYNVQEKVLSFLKPGSDHLFGHGIYIPVDILDLTSSIVIWDFIGGLFLPVLSPGFSFEANYANYESIYTDFEIEFKDTFKLKRKKFEGYSYSFKYTETNEVEGLPVKKYYNEALIQYNSQGVLYNYEGRNEQSEEVDGKYETYWIYDMSYTIDTIEKSLAVSFKWMFGFVGLVFIAIVFRFHIKNR